jgi:hypothetical protein
MPRGIPNNPKTAKKRGRPAKKSTAVKAVPKLHEFYVVSGTDCNNNEAFHSDNSSEQRARIRAAKEPTADYVRTEGADIFGPYLAVAPEDAIRLGEQNQYVIDNDNILSVVDMTAGTVKKFKVGRSLQIEAL